MKDLPFEEFLFCFGNSRKVDISFALSEIWLDDASGKRIPFSSRFAWSNDSSEKKITAFYIFLKQFRMILWKTKPRTITKIRASELCSCSIGCVHQNLIKFIHIP